MKIYLNQVKKLKKFGKKVKKKEKRLWVKYKIKLNRVKKKEKKLWVN